MEDIAIIYDTSYLMEGYKLSGGGQFQQPQMDDDPDDRPYWPGELFAPYWLNMEELTTVIAFYHIVPLEVQKEIDRHLKPRATKQSTSQKRLKASRARKVIVWLAEHENPISCLAEPALTSMVKPYPDVSLLGADSPTDRLLLAYALDIVEARDFSAVFIATVDGGIQKDIVRLRKKTGRNMFCLSTPTPSAKLRAFVHRAIDPDDERPAAQEPLG